MKQILNTLFVTTEGAYLKKEGETVIVKVKKEVKLQLPIHTINGIVCFGRVLCSPALLGFCGQRQVTISFLSPFGRFLARVTGPTTGNVLLRRAQYAMSDDPLVAGHVARSILLGKAGNCRASLQRFMRDHRDSESIDAIESTVKSLAGLINKIQRETDLQKLRGLEGLIARKYFTVLPLMVKSQKESFEFGSRSRRPPRDNFNALVSFIYTLVLHDLNSALETVGLDPQVGFLHRQRPGRPSLALDIMEEFRPWLADRLALSLINLQQIQASGFMQTESGGIVMDESTRKSVLVAYQKRKQETIRHPFIGETLQIGLLFFTQSLIFSRFIRGDLDGYAPFFWK